MSLRDSRLEAWEAKLKSIFDQIDREVEERYGDVYPRHPSRPADGSTGNPAADGLFNIGAAWSPGYGRNTGPGYTVDIRISTLSRVDGELRKKIEAYIIQRLREELPKKFARPLEVVRDGDVFRIRGDLGFVDR